jgi:hypothetical protein
MALFTAGYVAVNGSAGSDLGGTVVMRDFLVALNISQCTDLQGVVVNGIGFVAVIDVTELTVHQETLLAVQPEDIVTIPCRVYSRQGPDDFACRDKGIGKQALAMDGTVSNINSISGHLTFSFVLTGVDCTVRAMNVTDGGREHIRLLRAGE